MSEPRSFRRSILVRAAPEDLYDLVSDIGRTGEWSPVCTSCWWDDASEAGRVGAWFTGRNELSDRSWETRSQVVSAERGREFAWIVGGTFVRWGFTFERAGGATDLATANPETTLTETWDFLPAGIAMFEARHGDRAEAQIEDRTQQAYDGIPRTLESIKRIAETS